MLRKWRVRFLVQTYEGGGGSGGSGGVGW